MVERQTNWQGQWRVDVSHLRAQESSVAADFDVLAGRAMSGGQPLVVSGFNLVTTGALGAPATNLLVAVATGCLMHTGASEAGTIFSVPASRAAEQLTPSNPNVSGSFTASATNNVGLDLRRSADPTTSDNVQFLQAPNGPEVAKNVPLARTLNYRFVISASPFSAQSNVLPIAQVVTDSNNNVVSLVDARNLAFRLGTGGDSPNIKSSYGWPGTRAENLTGNVFAGGDKSIGSLRDFTQAVETRLWEVGGGEYWYSATADRNVTLVFSGATFPNGENFTWSGTNLHWQGLRFLFDNSTGYYNVVQDQTTDSPGLTDLADGQCVYVDLDRTSNATRVAQKGTLASLGQSAVPGQRQVLAYRLGSTVYERQWRYPVGTTFQPATTSSLGVVQLAQTPATPSTPVVFNPDVNGQFSNSVSGAFSAVTGLATGTGNALVGRSSSGLSLFAQNTASGTSILGLSSGSGLSSSPVTGTNAAIVGYGSGPEIGVAGFTTTATYTSGKVAGILGFSGGGSRPAGYFEQQGSGNGVEVSGGNVQLDSTKDYAYSAAVSRTAYSMADEWSIVPGGGYTINAAQPGTTTITSIGCAQNTTASAQSVAFTHVRVPAGATITGWQVYAANGDSATHNLTFFGGLNTYDATAGDGGFSTVVQNTPAGGSVVTLTASTGNGAWYSIPLSSNSHVVPSDGTFSISVTLPSVGTANAIQVTAIRVSYTQTAVRPTV